jgi:head-tail adaptor
VIGAMNRRLTLQQPSGTTGYADVETVWGSIRLSTVGVPEQLRAGAPVTTTVFEARIWLRDDVRADWRVVDDGCRVFQITGYGDPDGSARQMRLFLTEAQ